jgi:MerR family transcriptional regulator, aldehyde-responsive regulator
MGCSIKEAAEHVGLTVHTVRYYELAGLLPPLKRDGRKNRIFFDSDIEWLQFIRCLRDTGMSISEMKHFVEISLEGDHTIKDRIRILQEHKRDIETKMEEMNRFLKKIDGKLSWYQSRMKETDGQ